MPETPPSRVAPEVFIERVIKGVQEMDRLNQEERARKFNRIGRRLGGATGYICLTALTMGASVLITLLRLHAATKQGIILPLSIGFRPLAFGGGACFAISLLYLSRRGWLAVFKFGLLMVGACLAYLILSHLIIRD